MAASIRLATLASMASLLVLLAASPALAVKGVNPDGSLDKPTVSKAYFEGEFWTVINALEAFRKSGYKMNRDDSIYTFKYLSVVYAAEPASRLKAESYMHQLLRMMPTIDLLDLYISDHIQSIFAKVKSDYEKLVSLKGSGRPGDSASAPVVGVVAAPKPGPVPAPAPAPAQAQGKTAAQSNGPTGIVATPVENVQPSKSAGKVDHGDKGKRANLKVWAPLAIGGVGIATAAYFFLSQETSSNAKQPRSMDATLVWPKEGSP